MRDPIPSLYTIQEERLSPVLKQFEEKFGIAMKATKSKFISHPDLSEDTVKDPQQMAILEKYLRTLVGIHA